MCWSGSLASRRATSSQNLGSNPESGTRCNWLRGTPCSQAAIISASFRGDSTPASASRAAARAISSSSRLTSRSHRASLDRLSWISAGGDLPGPVGVDQRRDHRVEVAVDDLVQVVGLKPDPVVGYPVLREVVGADPLGPVDRRYLAAALGGGLRVGLLLGDREQPRPQHAHGLLLVLELALLVLAR